MRSLLLALALTLPLGAAAQEWTYESDFPTAADRQFSSTHGLAVDGEGRIWVQPFSSSVDSVEVDGTFRKSGTVLVFDADGTEAVCSPVRFLANESGAVIDTLGIATNASGTLETQTGRGLRADKDGNVLITQGNLLFKVDHTSCNTGGTANTVRQLAKAQPFTGSMIAAGTDDDGNFYISQVVGPRPIKMLAPDLTEIGDIGMTRTFNRSMLAASDGGGDGGVAVWDFSYTTHQPVVYYRADDLSDFDSLGVTPRGMDIESGVVQSSNGYVWFSAGSPNDAPNRDPVVETHWQANAWYGFALEDLFTFDTSGDITGVIEVPTPRDSIIWNEENTAGRPRAIAFSADGMTAYVGQFSQNAPATQKFVKSAVAGEEGPQWRAVAELRQNQPNPFSGRTEIAYSTLEAGHVRLRVFDATGRAVATLVDAPVAAGDHTATFDASDLAAGVYVYAIEVDGFGTSRRMLVVR